MHFWMDISRDDEGEVMSVVAGCNICDTRTVTNNIAEARSWVAANAEKFHHFSESRKINQIGDTATINQKSYRPAKVRVAPTSHTKPAVNEILALLDENPQGMTTTELQIARDANFNGTFKLLDRMQKAGLIRKGKQGRKVLWEALDTPSEPLEQKAPTMTAPEETKPVESLPELVRPYYGNPKVLQGFGDHSEVYGRFGFKGHMGLDIGIVMQPVLAAHDGIVEYAGDGGEWPFMGAAAGNCILLKGETLRTGYAHLERAYSAIGDVVKAGDVIGLSGDTGATTGYHLHFEVMPLPTDHKNGYAGRVDPTPYLPTQGTP